MLSRIVGRSVLHFSSLPLTPVLHVLSNRKRGFPKGGDAAPCRFSKNLRSAPWKVFPPLALGLLVLCAPACSGDKGTGPQNGEQPGHFQFTRDPSTGPVVSSGTAGWPIFPSDPAVVKDAEGYHLFYTTYFCKAHGTYYYSWDAGNLSACNITDVATGTGYAFSSDKGYTWEFRGSPVLLPGDEPWQRGDIETPHVAVLGDTLYLFYSAWGEYQGKPFPHRFQVGVATLNLNGKTIRQRLLEDLAEFTSRPGPLLPYNVTTTSFDNNTQEPSVVIRDGLLELFYVGVSFTLPDQHADAPGQSIQSVGMAKAVFRPNLQLVSQSTGYVLENANITEVKYFDGAYRCFSTTLEQDGGEFHHNEKINYFRSADGVDWSDSEVLLRPETAFDDWGMMAPTVVVEDNEVVMFYSGWGIEDHVCFPEPFRSDIRFGYPTADDRCIYGSVGRAVAARPAIK
jgi:predicted GH43/DUF377 family glycosyl hydrolase